MSSATDFTDEEEFMDDQSLDDPGSVHQMSYTSFGSYESWDPLDIQDSDSDYTVVSGLEDFEFLSDDSNISNDPENIPIVDPNPL